jgi:hypothetical protein
VGVPFKPFPLISFVFPFKGQCAINAIIPPPSVFILFTL